MKIKFSYYRDALAPIEAEILFLAPDASGRPGKDCSGKREIAPEKIAIKLVGIACYS